MSLVVLLVIEFRGWIAFNRITPFSTPRATIAMTLTSVSALLMTTYFTLYQPPALALLSLQLFAIMNALIALIIGLTSFTQQMSHLH